MVILGNRPRMVTVYSEGREEAAKERLQKILGECYVSRENSK